MLLRSRLAWGILPLIAAMIACAAPGASQPTSTFDPAAQTADHGGLLTPDMAALTVIAPSDVPPTVDANQPTPEGGYAYLDPCTLVTSDEAAAILGVPVQADPSGTARNAGACMYMTEDRAKVVFVAAEYGDGAKTMILTGLSLIASITEDAAIDTYDADMQAKAPTLGLVDFFNEITLNMPAVPGAPATVFEPVSGIGDSAYYTWTESDARAGLSFVTGQKYATVSVKGLAGETARATLESLARQVLSRLPEGFHTLNPPTP
jgi:hypothetical protein